MNNGHIPSLLIQSHTTARNLDIFDTVWVDWGVTEVEMFERIEAEDRGDFNYPDEY